MKPYFLLFVLFAVSAKAQVQLTEFPILMGSKFQITVVEKDTLKCRNAIDFAIQEIKRIEAVISEWDSVSEVSKVNGNAGIKPVKVSWELFMITQQAISFSKITDGAFDISVAAMDKIWKFDGSMDKLPDSATVKHAIRNVGWRNIILNELDTTIFLSKIGMKIGFGSIGKGYAADRVADMLVQQGVWGCLVNASGDIATRGNQLNGTAWIIGINNPYDDEITKVLKLKNYAIATSGNYEKYVVFDDVRYSHIINPSTGYPATGITSVTVWGPSTAIANGLSTSIMVLGLAGVKKLIRHFPHYNYYIICENEMVVKKKGLNWRKIYTN
jgi:thiamine biosynthesis lipoprotein